MYLESTAVSTFGTCLLYTNRRWLVAGFNAVVEVGFPLHATRCLSSYLASWKQYHRVRWQHSVLNLVSMLAQLINSTQLFTQYFPLLRVVRVSCIQTGTWIRKTTLYRRKTTKFFKNSYIVKKWEYTLCLPNLTTLWPQSYPSKKFVSFVTFACG